MTKFSWGMVAALLASTLSASARAASIRFEPYVFTTFDGRSVNAELGHLTVPENRTASNHKTIELALVRFRSFSTNPGPPIVYLAGGPGGSGIDTGRGSRFDIFLTMLEFGDLILLDQRGTGRSSPNLDCRQSLDLPLDRVVTADQWLGEYLDQSQACAKFWRRRGVDLDAYNSEESADDLEDLRVALGADKIRLWGISYGTHLALATLRRHPGSIAQAVLHGVEGPDHTYKLPKNVDKILKKVAGLIRNDPQVGPAVPDLIGTVKRVMADLAAHPVTQTAVDPISGAPVTVTLGAFDVQLAMAKSMGDTEFFRALPLLAVAAQQGDFSVLANSILVERREGLGSAMAFAMDCASGATGKRWKKIERQTPKTVLGRAIDFPFPEVCSAWAVADLGDAYRSKLTCDVPTLFISGTLDGRTPLSNAKEIARGFSHSEQLLIEGAGHDDDLFLSDPDIRRVIQDFFAGRPLATHRIVLPPLSFFPLPN